MYISKENKPHTLLLSSFSLPYISGVPTKLMPPSSFGSWVLPKLPRGRRRRRRRRPPLPTQKGQQYQGEMQTARSANTWGAQKQRKRTHKLLFTLPPPHTLRRKCFFFPRSNLGNSPSAFVQLIPRIWTFEFLVPFHGTAAHQRNTHVMLPILSHLIPNRTFGLSKKYSS